MQCACCTKIGRASYKLSPHYEREQIESAKTVDEAIQKAFRKFERQNLREDIADIYDATN